MNLGRGAVSFPVVNRGFGHPDMNGNIFLSQSEVESFSSDMIAYRCEVFRILRRLWLLSFETYMAER